MFWLWLIVGLVGCACTLSSASDRYASVSPEALPSNTFLPPPPSPARSTPSPAVSTPIWQPTDTPNFAPSPTATPTGAVDLDVGTDLEAIVESADWPLPGLNPERALRWEVLARTGAFAASGQEAEQLLHFIRQWNGIRDAAAKMSDSDDFGYVVRVVDLPASTPVIYAAVIRDDLSGDREQLFLIARGQDDVPFGMIPAPAFEGLTQRISADGRRVEYIDEKSGSSLLLADAYRPDLTSRSDRILHARLTELYRKFHPNVKADLYPRFYFPVEDVDASFFRIETNLTYLQILRMHEAFALFERPELAPLKVAFFGSSTKVIIEKNLGSALGLTYRGSSVMELDRLELFGNRYDLAEVLAHEGAHVIQGWSGGDLCEVALRMEVGDRTVAADFLTWPAEKVIEGVRSTKIGAYHVSMWIYNQLNRLNGSRRFWIELIRTGKINGVSVVPACEN